jgi:hypothetical protein
MDMSNELTDFAVKLPFPLTHHHISLQHAHHSFHTRRVSHGVRGRLPTIVGVLALLRGVNLRNNACSVLDRESFEMRKNYMVTGFRKVCGIIIIIFPFSMPIIASIPAGSVMGFAGGCPR